MKYKRLTKNDNNNPVITLIKLIFTNSSKSKAVIMTVFLNVQPFLARNNRRVTSNRIDIPDPLSSTPTTSSYKLGKNGCMYDYEKRQ